MTDVKAQFTLGQCGEHRGKGDDLHVDRLDEHTRARDRQQWKNEESTSVRHGDVPDEVEEHRQGENERCRRLTKVEAQRVTVRFEREVFGDGDENIAGDGHERDDDIDGAIDRSMGFLAAQGDEAMVVGEENHPRWNVAQRSGDLKEQFRSEEFRVESSSDDQFDEHAQMRHEDQNAQHRRTTFRVQRLNEPDDQRNVDENAENHRAERGRFVGIERIDARRCRIHRPRANDSGLQRKVFVRSLFSSHRSGNLRFEEAQICDWCP